MLKRIIFIILSCILLSIISTGTTLAAMEGYVSSYVADVDGDDKDDLFIYKLEKGLGGYKGSLTITNYAGDVLWRHDFKMTLDDLEGDLLINEGNITVAYWVKHFFDGSLVYGGEFQKLKISPEDIDADYLDFYSERLQVPSIEIMSQIVSESINSTFSYRASWREDLHMLVYLPGIGKFISYSGGEYGQ